MLTFNGFGEEVSAYVPGGKNYKCPSCGKGFTTVGGMLNHIQARPQCRLASATLRVGPKAFGKARSRVTASVW